MENKSILVIDDDEDILSAAKLFLDSNSFCTDTASNPEQALAAVKKTSFDVILLDMNFSPGARSGKEGLNLLKEILKTDPSASVIMITAYSNIDLAVQAVKAGAVHFIEKPWHNEKLLAAVEMAARLNISSHEIFRLEQLTADLNNRLDQSYQEIIGKSPQMKHIFSTINKIAPTEANVLITGENGTGKELIARAIHRASARAKQPFVAVDMGAVPESLFEAELFGAEAGAFTDARKLRIGYFESAKNGTLFLDEIGNVPMSVSPKLLRCLETRQIFRIGKNTPVDINIRLVCATNRNLQELIKSGDFREDLLYRINTIEIKIPPLRERMEDIPLLIDFYLKIFRQKYNKPEKNVSNDTLGKLKKYPWPGNVRELKHAVERAVLLGDSDSITPDDFILHNSISSEDIVSSCDYKIEGIEKQVILKVINMYPGNISRIAETLGISRQSLYRRMEKYDIKI